MRFCELNGLQLPGGKFKGMEDKPRLVDFLRQNSCVLIHNTSETIQINPLIMTECKEIVIWYIGR